MRDDRDFAMNAEDPKPADDSTAPSPAAPIVVIEYRRGLSAVLAPPVLILLATLVILSYQRQTPIRPITTAPPPADSTPKAPAGQGRIIMVESSGAGAAFEPIMARAEMRFGPPAPPASPPAPAPVAVARLTPAPPALAAEAAKPVGEDETEGAPSPFDLDPRKDRLPSLPAPGRGIAVEAPPPPAPEPAKAQPPPPAPRLGAFVVETPPPPAPAAEPVPPAVARAEPEAPRPTKEQILDDIRREAEQKNAEQKQMELLKLQARSLQLYEMYQKAQASRVPFRNDLRLLIESMGNQAGPEIKQLCEKYGRDTAKEIEDGVKLDLFRSARWTWLRRVEMMRARGLPEPRILDHLANELDWTRGSRGGPRDENEVRVRAARLLLTFPIAPPLPSASDPALPLAGARPSTKSVAGVAPAPGPGPVRRSQ
jgi:hypothetical protein